MWFLLPITSSPRIRVYLPTFVISHSFCQKLWKVPILKDLRQTRWIKCHLNNGAYPCYGPNKSISRFRRQHSNNGRHIPAIFLRVDSIVCCHIEWNLASVAAAGDNYALPLLISCGARPLHVSCIARPRSAGHRQTIKQSIGTARLRKRAATPATTPCDSTRYLCIELYLSCNAT